MGQAGCLDQILELLLFCPVPYHNYRLADQTPPFFVSCATTISTVGKTKVTTLAMHSDFLGVPDDLDGLTGSALSPHVIYMLCVRTSGDQPLTICTSYYYFLVLVLLLLFLLAMISRGGHLVYRCFYADRRGSMILSIVAWAQLRRDRYLDLLLGYFY